MSNHKSAWNVVLVLVFAFSLVSGLSPRPASAEGPASVLAADQDATVATEWMKLLYQRIEAEAVSAPGAARIYAYAGVTLYEAVLPGIPGNKSLAGQLNDMPVMPHPDDKAVYDWPSSANAALATVIDGLFTDGTADTHQAFAALKDRLTTERKATVAAEVVDRSLKFGEAVGQAILGWVAKDHFQETRSMTYTLPAGKPEYWVLTTDGTKPVEPYWGRIRPFALPTSDACNVPPNMPYSTDPSSAFYAQAMEVKNVRDNLTNEQKAIATFWVDTPGISGTPSGHWTLIETQLVDQLHLHLDRAAEMYALVGVALGDAFISCWEIKYQVVLLRPETYIKQNIRRSWAPYIQTPPFPGYPSGHSVVSGAAVKVLTYLFGTVAFKDDTHQIHNLPPRFFTSFEAAAQEAAMSRLYGGIHFRADNENGLEQGRCVGQTAISRIQLRINP
jgi:hypothetical protein